MSLAKLAALSHGRITDAKLARLQTDLEKVSVDDSPHTHSLLTRSSQTVGRFSKAVYQRVVLMIASL